ncbi:MAG: calcium-binding protein [Cyanobacteria bacterium J06623_7]
MDNIQLQNGQNIQVNDILVAPIGQPAVEAIGDNTRVNVNFGGAINADDAGNTAVLASGNNIEVSSNGEISGAFNGVSSTGNNFALRNRNGGVISSDSRAVDISDGNNLTVTNDGSILGTGNQRNGTFYIDGTVDNLNLSNESSGSIDAGAGNIGDGLSVQVGAAGDLINESININNRGTIAGRGQAEFAPGEGRLAANGSSGVRYFNGSGADEATVTGTLNNTGTISSEVNVGFLGGVVVEDGVAYEGQIRNSGSIFGPRNGLYIGDAEHDLEIFNEVQGRIESGSRVVNLDGDNVSFQNQGTILGTGDQRNGTLYVDGTGDNISLDNRQNAIIDAGEGNNGSGVSIQVGSGDDLETSVDIVNNGTIQGRGTDNVPVGLRLFVGSGLEASSFTGDITNGNFGVIASEESTGLLIEEDINFNGEINNRGTISGGNGIAIDATGATGSVELFNQGTLEGDVILGDGNDTLLNRSSDDLNITGGAGDDLLTGGSGLNIYSFELGSGQDTITDFQTSQDVLDLGAYFDSTSDVLGSATQVGSDALIDLGNDNSITLNDVAIGDLSADNFSF